MRSIRFESKLDIPCTIKNWTNIRINILSIIRSFKQHTEARKQKCENTVSIVQDEIGVLEDDGVGLMQTGNVMPKPGLTGNNERASEIGADVDIKSVREKGAVLR